VLCHRNQRRACVQAQAADRLDRFNAELRHCSPVWALQQGFRMLRAATKLGADQAPLWSSRAPGCRQTTMSLATSFSSKFPSPAHWDKSSNGRSNSRWLEVADVRVKYVGTSCAAVASQLHVQRLAFVLGSASRMQVSHRSRWTRSIRAASAASASEDRSDLQPGQMHRAAAAARVALSRRQRELMRRPRHGGQGRGERAR